MLSLSSGGGATGLRSGGAAEGSACVSLSDRFNLPGCVPLLSTSAVSGGLLPSGWFARDQHGPSPAHNGLLCLILHVKVDHHRSAADSRQGLCLCGGQLRVNRVADEDGLDEPPVVDLTECEHGSFEDAGPPGEPRCEGGAQQPVGDLSSELCALAELCTGVDRIVVSAQPGERQDIVFTKVGVMGLDTLRILNSLDAPI